MRDTIDMALEAKVAFDLDEYPDIWQVYLDVGKEEIEHLVALVRADEREALLDLVDDYAKNNTDLKAAIRARGNT